jgi:hypothetical protein
MRRVLLVLAMGVLALVVFSLFVPVVRDTAAVPGCATPIRGSVGMVQATVSFAYYFFGSGTVIYNGQYQWTSYSLLELACPPWIG